MLEHPAADGELIELAQIELHHEARGILVGTIQGGRQHRILRREQVDGAGEVEGVMRAANCPDGAGREGRDGADAQAAEQAECEEPLQ